MSEPSPRPWRVVKERDPEGGNNCIVDADGKEVVGFYDDEGWLSRENAELIVAAVNERDKLHDFVKRLVCLAENLLFNYKAHYRESKSSMDFVAYQRKFIEEVKAAINKGENK